MKILLVDDSKSARYALRLQLQRHGATVETADAAESALERIRETPPDAVFMDHTMPGMNGFEALDILKATPATRHIPVVMCTSNGDPEFIAQAERRGAFDILSKSTTPEKLESLLDRLKLAAATPAPVAKTAPAPEPADARPEGTADPAGGNELDERIRTLTRPFVDELAQRLTQDLIANTEKTLVSRLEEEAEQLQKRVIKSQSEEAQLTTNRLIIEVVPREVRQQLERERQNIARMIQELIDVSLDSLVEEPGFIRRIVDTVETTAASNAEQDLGRRAEEIAETVAWERAGVVTERLLQSSRPASGRMYLLATGAALVGVISAAVVFLLLS